MSAEQQDDEVDKAATPEVPGALRLAWMLFAQPVRLHRMFLAWGFKGDVTLWQARQHLLARNKTLNSLLVVPGFLWVD